MRIINPGFTAPELPSPHGPGPSRGPLRPAPSREPGVPALPSGRELIGEAVKLAEAAADGAAKTFSGIAGAPGMWRAGFGEATGNAGIAAAKCMGAVSVAVSDGLAGIAVATAQAAGSEAAAAAAATAGESVRGAIEQNAASAELAATLHKDHHVTIGQTHVALVSSVSEQATAAAKVEIRRLQATLENG